MVALGDSDFAILEGASLLVTHFVSRKNDVQGHLLRFVHHHQHVVLGEILERFCFEQLFNAELFEKEKMLISRVYQQITHKKTSFQILLDCLKIYILVDHLITFFIAS
jgi:hypothetical protein